MVVIMNTYTSVIKTNHLITLLLSVLTLLLTACGGDDSSTSTSPSSAVIPAPSITSFTAASSPIMVGDSTTLTAIFTNGTGVIDNGIGIISSNTAVTISPNTSTTYTLTITNSAGTSVSSSVTVEITSIASKTLIIDHTSIALFDRIPQTFIDEVKKRLFILAGESHATGYGRGLELVQADDPKFNVETTWSGAAKAYTDQYLRWNYSYLDNDSWSDSCGEEDFWTNLAARTDTLAGLQTIGNNYTGSIYFGFGWCWDMSWINGPTSTKDPIHGCGWAGTSVDGPDGDRPWGIDAADTIITGNSISLQTYLDAVDFYNNNAPRVKTIFTTGPVDGDINNEKGYQRHLKHEAIRNYVQANGGILFDYADILSWDYNLNQAFPESWTDFEGVTHTWNGRNPDLATGGDGYLRSHISEEGARLLGKAIWVMLALDAGWDGT